MEKLGMDEEGIVFPEDYLIGETNTMVIGRSAKDDEEYLRGSLKEFRFV